MFSFYAVVTFICSGTMQKVSENVVFLASLITTLLHSFFFRIWLCWKSQLLFILKINSDITFSLIPIKSYFLPWLLVIVVVTFCDRSFASALSKYINESTWKYVYTLYLRNKNNRIEKNCWKLLGFWYKYIYVHMYVHITYEWQKVNRWRHFHFISIKVDIAITFSMVWERQICISNSPFVC